ncbi:MAG: hypothetical protein JO133_11995 [Burkholderiaceae bacterium]|nr:hypothetical protein [Burkholderiaceae bacterium]
MSPAKFCPISNRIDAFSCCAMLVFALGAALLSSGARAQSAASPPTSASKGGPQASPPVSKVYSHGLPSSHRSQMWYAARYGVDHLQVRSISSGASLEFRYRVLDPDKAHLLGDKSAKPYITDWKTGNKLTVPTMEKIGQLRQQVTTLEQGREYWMVFANPGKLVKPGDKIDVNVGPIHLDGLIVE